MSNKSIRVGFYPGTFDPVTYGHTDIIERASHLADKLIIGVAKESGKSPLLDLSDRVNCLVDAIAQSNIHQGCSVEVISFDGLLVDALRQYSAQFIVRGLRSGSDFDYESQMTGLNRQMAPDLETVFLMASNSYRSISSSFVRRIARLGGDISPFVPKAAESYVLDRLHEERK